MELNYKTLGEGKPLIILHGLFGSLDNWLSIAKTLSEQYPYKVYLVDQRNHGQSPHSDVFDYATMAEDLNGFIDTHRIDQPIILGHSMGGKAAMTFAVDHPDKWSKLIVVDISPKAYPVHHDKILEGLAAVDIDGLQSRNEADEQLGRYVGNIGIRQFLLKNLSRRKEGGFEWKINLPVIKNNIEIIGEGLNKKLAGAKEVLFIRGGNSDYIQDHDFELIKSYFPGARIETIKNAGHWVHAEQPAELLAVVGSFL